MSQQVYLQQLNKTEHRQNLRQEGNRQNQNTCLELQQEVYSIRKEAAIIKQDYFKLKKQIEERHLELQEYLRTHKVVNENLLDLRLDNENKKVKIQNKEESLLKLMNKRSEMEEICSAIQAQCDPLSYVLIDIVQAKEEVIHCNSISQENLEKLKEKFKHIYGKSVLLKQNLKSMALNEADQMEKKKAKKLKEIALAKDNLQTLWNQLDNFCKQLNDKKDDIKMVEKENVTMKAENEHIIEELKKQTQIEENQYDSRANLSTLLIKEVEEMEINNKLIVEEINQWESKTLTLQSDFAELQLKSKTLNEDLVSKETWHKEAHENALHIENELETCETEVATIKHYAEEQNSNLNRAKEELQNATSFNNERKEEISKLQNKLEQKLVQMEQHKFRAVSKIEELKANIKTKENELSNSLIDLQRVQEQLATLEGQCKQHEDLQMQIQQESQQLQIDHDSKLQKLEEFNNTIMLKNVEVDSLLSLLTDKETEQRRLNEDLDKAQRKYDESVSLREREKMEVDLELKNAIREMEKTENNCHWIMQQTMACVDSCKQNYAKHVEDKKEELQACKLEKLHLVHKLSEIHAEKDECKTKLEKEVFELERTVKELELKLTKEIEHNADASVIPPPGAHLKTQQKLHHSSATTLEKFTYKEPKMSVSSIGHPVSTLTEHYKKQAVKRKQSEFITTFKPKVPQSAQNQETFSQPTKASRVPERNFKKKFFKSKHLHNIREENHNTIEDLDYYKFE